MRRLLLFASMSFTVACGSRSGLLTGFESDAAAGGGGATTGGSGGSTTGGTGGVLTGGSGGIPPGGTGGVVSCSMLTHIPPILTVETEPSQKFDDGLRLTESSDDGTQVTGVFVRQFAKPTNVLHHVTFFPWGSWQVETLGPVYSTTLETDEYRVGRAPGGRVAIAARLFELTLYPGVPTNSSGVGLAPSILLPNVYAAFVTPRVAGWESPRFLVGTGDGTNVGVSVVDEAVIGTAFPLGCAGSQPPQMGAVAYAGEWLVALSTGAPVGSCGTSPTSMPTRIDVFRIGQEGSASFVTSIEVGAQIVDVEAAPHPDGMYVVWSSSGSPFGAVQAVRVSATANTVVAGPITLPGDMMSFEASAMGDRLVIARQNSDVSSAEKFLVSVFDESLGMIDEEPLESDEVVSGPTSSLGSRDGKSVLVAYTNPFKNPWRVRVARFDCVP